MPNYRITLAYDGRNYLGWQRHGDKPTIQYECEKALEFLSGVPVAVRASGRTDRGAHATGQVINVPLPLEVGTFELKRELNRLLPKDIHVRAVSLVNEDFHARKSAIGKRYRYLIFNDELLPNPLSGRVWHVQTPLDFSEMKKSCPQLVGEHDFASFATRTNFKQKNTTRTITLFDMHRDKQLITIDIAAESFLYKMVRNIVRAIVKIGEGRSSRSDLKRILAAKDRKAAPGTAPASGLYLEKVYYSKREQMDDFETIRNT